MTWSFWAVHILRLKFPCLSYTAPKLCDMEFLRRSHFTIKTFSRLRRGDFRYTTISCMNHILRLKFFLASGEAILGTQRYFIQALYTNTLSKHFTQALHPSTLHEHFIKALYTSALSMYFQKHSRNTCQGITKVLRQGNKTRY